MKVFQIHYPLETPSDFRICKKHPSSTYELHAFVLTLVVIQNHWKKIANITGQCNKRHDLGMLYFALFSTVRGVTPRNTYITRNRICDIALYDE